MGPRLVNFTASATPMSSGESAASAAAELTMSKSRLSAIWCGRKACVMKCR
jgi:hypothetical protein